MGNWALHVEGVGCHHNKDNSGDIDHLASEFVKLVKAHGHGNVKAVITYGGAEVLPKPEKSSG